MKENGQLSCRYHGLWTFSCAGLGVTSKNCTCLCLDSHIRDPPAMEYSGTKAALYKEELIESWLFITEDNL